MFTIPHRANAHKTFFVLVREIVLIISETINRLRSKYFTDTDLVV